MFETSSEARLVDTLFGPIEDRDGADRLAKLLAIVVLALAAVEAALALLVGLAAIAVAVAEAALAGLLAWRRSVIGAVALLGVALAAGAGMLLEVVRGEGPRYAWAFAIALAGVWAGGRAVQCAAAAHRFAHESHPTAAAKS